MFTRLTREELDRLLFVIRGLFGLEDKREVPVNERLPYLGGDVLNGMLKSAEQDATTLLGRLSKLEIVTDEVASGGARMYDHYRIERDLANSIFALLVPFVDLIEKTLAGQIASGRSTVQSESWLIQTRKNLVSRINSVRGVLSPENREAVPSEKFYPYQGVEQLREGVGTVIGLLKDLAASMTAFAEQSASKMIQSAALRNQAREIKSDLETWDYWKRRDDDTFWRVPSDELVTRTRGHLETYLIAIEKVGTNEDLTKASHPETDYSVIETAKRIRKALELLPELSEQRAAA